MPFLDLHFRPGVGVPDIYSFQLTDATDKKGARVRIEDGEVNGESPEGMGSDEGKGKGDFKLRLPNDDKKDYYTHGENDIVAIITYDTHGVIDSTKIKAFAPKNVPETQFKRQVIRIGYALVEVEGYGKDAKPRIVELVNTQCGDIFYDPLPPDVYSFQMVDASIEGTARVMLFDGRVNGVLPDGMGGNDLIKTVINGDEIWLLTRYDPNTFNVTSAKIKVLHPGYGPQSTNGFSAVLIGWVQVDQPGYGDQVPAVFAHNSHCGDVIIEIPHPPKLGAHMLGSENGLFKWFGTKDC